MSDHGWTMGAAALVFGLLWGLGKVRIARQADIIRQQSESLDQAQVLIRELRASAPAEPRPEALRPSTGR